MQTSEKYDAIVIGSGIGGLTNAVLLTKVFKKKVLVLEQHFVAGGQTHEFMRVKDGKKYFWDVGVHYVGEMGKGRANRKMFDFITDGKLEWHKMPHHFENFVYPDFNFRQPAHPKEFAGDLISLFPEEENGIKQYFKDIDKAAHWFQSHIASKAMPSAVSFLMNLFKKDATTLPLSITKDYLDKHFKDNKIKALLTSIWGDYGLPPGKSAFVMHALVVKSYLYGGYYPVGGAGAIADAMVPIIENGGGSVITSRTVEKIILKGNKAVGVRVRKGNKEETYYADKIVSDVGAYNTYLNLLPENNRIPFKEEIKNALSSLSANTLYLGLKDSPEKLGIKGENTWIFTSYKHDENYKRSNLSDDVLAAFISFPSLKNPKATTHTAEIISFTQYDSFERWKETKWMKRGEEYLSYKNELSKKLLDFAEKYIPGLQDIVDYAELSTPLTLEHFTKWEKGSFYGIPMTPERYKYKWISPKTPLKNLFLTGSDAATIGVIGAMMGGMLTSAVMNGLGGYSKLMKALKK